MTETRGKKSEPHLNGSAPAEGKVSDKNAKEKELIEKFVHLREEAVRKGISDAQIRSSFVPKRKRDLKTIVTDSKFQTQALVVLVVAVLAYRLGAKDLMYEFVFESRCLVNNNILFSELARPLADCEMCRNLKAIPIERHMSTERFLSKYAYTKVPVLIKDATTNWTAMNTFSFDYFKNLYTDIEGALLSVEEECQFFPYKTDFETLAQALNMSDARATYAEGENPWYFGWSNCHPQVASKLRAHYERPYFLPNDSESSSLDWIFMGGVGIGAFVHLDSVARPSWQAQISGAKTWRMVPSPECESICQEMNITVHTGDIFVFDSNEWYHATFVEPGPLSITIGSEYD